MPMGVLLSEIKDILKYEPMVLMLSYWL